MLTVQQITDAPKQKQTIILPDGSQFVLRIEYIPMQVGWFIREITHLDFRVTNVRIVTSPNLLHQFRNQIPFGLAIFTDGNQEPVLPGDFLSGRSKMYVLSSAEVDQYEAILSGSV